jgi:histone-lysine N-methyltransferase SETMAR
MALLQLLARSPAMHADAAAAWACVLRRATPRTLAAAACTCRALAAAVVQLRACDVAAGAEDVPILAPSLEAAQALRARFEYTHACTGAAADAEDLTGGGCGCVGAACDPAQCACARARDGEPAYSPYGALRASLGEEAPLVECGPACSCGALCPNRVTQRRVSAPLSLHNSRCGWGVVTDAALPRGAFVCTYAGELLRCEEASRRLAAQDACDAANYIMVLREHTSKHTWTTCIDPTRAGNVGRFMNHACDGGSVELCAVRVAGWPVPRAAFFTRRRVAAGEELTYAYGPGAGHGAKPCHCGTAVCTGVLPFDCAL